MYPFSNVQISNRVVTCTMKTGHCNEKLLTNIESESVINGGIRLHKCTVNRPVDEKSKNTSLPEVIVKNSSFAELPKKPGIVTNFINRGVAKPSPYNFKVTGKWTLRDQKNRCTSSFIVLWLVFLSVMLYATSYSFESWKKDNKRIEMLEYTVTKLEEKTHLLENRVEALVTYFNLQASKSRELPLSYDSPHSLIRAKRSDSETPIDRKDRKKNRRNRTRTKETVAVQFSGSKPYGFTMVPPEGVLGPWIESTNDFQNVEKFGAKLNDRNNTLEIIRDGLFMLYAQVTYQSINVSNSYSINVISNSDKMRSQPITTCSSFGKIAKDGEISCYTSVVKRLSSGDVVYLQQAQPNREIVFSKTYTYFGLISLI